jgi:hypothetical protein
MVQLSITNTGAILQVKPSALGFLLLTVMCAE